MWRRRLLARIRTAASAVAAVKRALPAVAVIVPAILTALFADAAGRQTFGLAVGPMAPTLYAAEQAAWTPGWQLTVTLELAGPAGRSRRPYVAVWIEDKDGSPVRTIALWYDGKSRWLPELRAWYRADRLRPTAQGSRAVDAVTAPTRPAGRYTVVWDGTDSAGTPVRAGTYIVCIEAAREHGTHQIIRQQVDLSGTAQHLTLPGGTEINAARIDYQQAGR